MKDFLLLKQNGEVECISVKDISELFNKEIMYNLLPVNTPLGLLHFYLDDEGLLKTDTKVNYSASLLGNYSGIVGDVIVAGTTSLGETTGIEDCGMVIRYLDFLKDRFRDLKMHKPRL